MSTIGNNTDHGFMVPEYYVRPAPDDDTVNLSSVFWGFTIAIAIFSAIRTVSQTQTTYRRCQRVTAFIYLIWPLWISSVISSTIVWFFQQRLFGPSFWFYLAISIFWIVQTNTLLQIIINRISLVMPIPSDANKLKYGCLAVMLTINTLTAIFWLPTSLQMAPMWGNVNMILNRIGKVLFCLMDASFNIYFVHLVRTRLVGGGLSRYTLLYRVNLAMILVSIGLDVILITLMSSADSMLYLQFQSLAYLAKFHIELNMAELIIKIVRASSGKEVDSNHGGGRGGTVLTNFTTSRKGKEPEEVTDESTGITKPSRAAEIDAKLTRKFMDHLSTGHNHTMRGRSSVHVERGDVAALAAHLGFFSPQDEVEPRSGIRKTVQTSVVHGHVRPSPVHHSRSSSVVELAATSGPGGARADSPCSGKSYDSR